MHFLPEIKCKVPMIANMKVTNNNEQIELPSFVSYNDVVEFECDEGFLLDGSDSSVCTEDEQLDAHEDMPTCKGENICFLNKYVF